uniref:Zn(2)-C6 fungal-type domain-containing protein n=1 Tax=Mycena chlorophos TaxID=658473 RepID=A0ABQ0KWT5_MYCCL|nr:predicted protein [Mycena chlorophos]
MSSQPSGSTQQHSNNTKRSGRTPIACINCRRRKRKCIFPDDSTSTDGTPQCTRCRTQNLACELPAPDGDQIAQERLWAFQYEHMSAGSGYPAASVMPASGYAASGSTASASSAPAGYYGQHAGRLPAVTAAALPYTGPPPLLSRPRYGGMTTYPSLALTSPTPDQTGLGSGYGRDVGGVAHGQAGNIGAHNQDGYAYYDPAQGYSRGYSGL